MFMIILNFLLSYDKFADFVILLKEYGVLIIKKS